MTNTAMSVAGLFCGKVGEVGMKEYIVQAIVQETIDSFDAHNAPELIRCCDCKRYFNGCCYSRVSNRINFTVEVPDDWFCADGERRTDDA